ncbi:DUF1249 domain-containing protein [Thiococcus pfennigii]|jgi:uncharacterized protein YqiB (DUF1249 family)|uniref:DUF1249 domain-containing protein n=1 Tax=Thiococcus pfennigii TaxID=1057 RepID=UPI0019041B3F|nr:DUF1249 domain-containing protein [Thiococcus pfennigii]MBK1732552.1 hypothetical protein [Thiococcus pfennigii]
MQAPLYPWLTRDLLLGRPTVGSLMGLCEGNYALLRRLVPGLNRIQGAHRASCPGDLDLHLDVLEQAPYTSTVRLTYLFASLGDATRRQAEPDACLRAYHDARQVEVLGLSPKSLPMLRDPDEPLLLDKWRVNLFLAKWLGYCAQQGYRFDCAERDEPPHGARSLGAIARLAACP